MKSEPFRIKIRHPCNQNWDTMPQVKGGLYCDQCCKIVTDFTLLSDEELIQTLNRKTKGELCGKFYQRQLEKVYVLQKDTPSASYPGFRLLLAGLLTLRLSSEAQIVSPNKPPVLKTDQKKRGTDTDAFKQSVKGKVFNRSTRQGIPASITLYAYHVAKEPVATFYADSIGHYEILLPGAYSERFFRLVYTSENYQERSVVVDRDKLPAYLPISLLPLITVEVVSEHPDYVIEESAVLGGVADKDYDGERVSDGILPPFTQTRIPFLKRAWYRVKAFFRR